MNDCETLDLKTSKDLYIMNFVVSVDKPCGGNHQWWTNFYSYYSGVLDEDVDDEEWSDTLTGILSQWNGYDVFDSRSFIGFDSKEDFMIFLLRWA